LIASNLGLGGFSENFFALKQQRRNRGNFTGSERQRKSGVTVFGARIGTVGGARLAVKISLEKFNRIIG